MDFLKSAVASALAGGPLGGYSVGERIDLDSSIWSLTNATKRVRPSTFKIRFRWKLIAGAGHEYQVLHLLL